MMPAPLNTAKGSESEVNTENVKWRTKKHVHWKGGVVTKKNK